MMEAWKISKPEERVTFKEFSLLVDIVIRKIQ